jgi:hypothetical protein
VREALSNAGLRARGTAVGAGRAITDSTIRLYDRAIDSMLATPHRVSSKKEALDLLATRADSEALGSQIQKLAIVLTPVLRRLVAARKIPGLRRVPVAASVITVASVANALRDGVRDVQVVGSYLAGRIEEATGQPADPDLVKKLTVDLYLSPDHRMLVTDRKVKAMALLRKWLASGVFGRDLGKAARKAIEAVSRLDIGRVLASWYAAPALPEPRDR